MTLKNVLRKAGAVSLRDAVLQSLRAICVIYTVGFGVYLPVSKYGILPATINRTWFILFATALVLSNVIPYIPKSGQSKWSKVDASRLKATAVAVSQVSSCVRERCFTPSNFLDITTRLLVAIQQEVEGITLDSEGVYINATLLTEDPARGENLIVRSRARSDRANFSYPKQGMLTWEAMVEKKRRYQPKFDVAGKDYHCILAFPLLVEDSEGHQTSVGVVSVDSGLYKEFSGLEDQIETRLLPYLSLLKLVLALEQSEGLVCDDRR